jgi:GT2 family glycosyltransferase
MSEEDNVHEVPSSWKVFHGGEPFCFSRNANIGIHAAKTDVLLVNDDVRLCREKSIRDLRSIAYQHGRVGILSPQFIGYSGNVLQRNIKELSGTTPTDSFIAFICVYIKRKVFESVGYFDDHTFDGGYGGEDVDFGIRTMKAGFDVAITPEVVMRHGFEEHAASATFMRAHGKKETDISLQGTRRKLIEKWGEDMIERNSFIEA